MKVKLLASVVVFVVAATAIWQYSRFLDSSRQEKHEEYLRSVGQSVLRYFGDNGDFFPKDLNDLISWEERVSSGPSTVDTASWWLEQCVCPLTNHKPGSLSDINDWTDIHLIPQLGLLDEEVMLAYCPAENHPDGLVYVVCWGNGGPDTTIEQNIPVRSMTQEEFDRRLEYQRNAFNAVGKPKHWLDHTR